MDIDEDDCVNRIGEIKRAPDAWKVNGLIINITIYNNGNSYFIDRSKDTSLYPVDYCLSEPAEPHCKLQFVPAIAILVTILNLVRNPGV